MPKLNCLLYLRVDTGNVVNASTAEVKKELLEESPKVSTGDSSPAKSTRFSKHKDSGKLKMENIKIGKEPELTRRRPVRQASKIYAARKSWVSNLWSIFGKKSW